MLTRKSRSITEIDVNRRNRLTRERERERDGGREIERHRDFQQCLNMGDGERKREGNREIEREIDGEVEREREKRFEC